MKAAAPIPSNFILLSYRYKAVLLKAFAQNGFSLQIMHYEVLKCITHSIDECTATSICSLLHRDKGQIARIIKLLTREKLITKKTVKDDSRSTTLHLTKKGVKQYQDLQTIENGVIDALNLGLNSSDLEQFNQIIEQMNQNLTWNYFNDR